MQWHYSSRLRAGIPSIIVGRACDNTFLFGVSSYCSVLAHVILAFLLRLTIDWFMRLCFLLVDSSVLQEGKTQLLEFATLQT